ncbi:uncharacterized protein [Asterias amurensis]|uniref:uncharacterized protein n=1 Tax=Asterias amurensis TaxID=7602 RepID=UPI003AB21038
MFPKGTVSAAGAPAEKAPVTAQKESTVAYMVGNTESQVDALNESYWRNRRVRNYACAVILTTLILVAGTLGGIFIVLTHTKGVGTTDPTPSLNHGREPLISNEVPLPKLPESTIRIKIDDGGLVPPTEPTTPDLIAIDDVTYDVELLPTVSLSTNGLSTDWIAYSDREKKEAEEEVSGDDQEETDFGFGEETDYGSSEETDYGSSEETDYGSDEETDYGSSEETDYGSSEETDYGSSEETDYGSGEETDYGSGEEPGLPSVVTSANDSPDADSSSSALWRSRFSVGTIESSSSWGRFDEGSWGRYDSSNKQ